MSKHHVLVAVFAAAAVATPAFADEQPAGSSGNPNVSNPAPQSRGQFTHRKKGGSDQKEALTLTGAAFGAGLAAALTQILGPSGGAVPPISGQ